MKNMEILLEKPTVEKLNDSDLEVRLSGAFILRSQFGSLVALRGELERLLGGDLIYHTISSQPLYMVHWNDLSEEKKKHLGARKNGY